MGSASSGRRLDPLGEASDDSLAASMRDFAAASPECLQPKYKPLYKSALELARQCDVSPSAALFREFGLANSRLRKELFGDGEQLPSLNDLMNDDDDDE